MPNYRMMPVKIIAEQLLIIVDLLFKHLLPTCLTLRSMDEWVVGSSSIPRPGWLAWKLRMMDRVYFVGLSCLLLLEFSRYARSTHVTIFTTVIGQNPIYGFNAAVPMLDIAFETVKDKYPAMFANITLLRLYNPTPVACCGETGDMMPAMAGTMLKIIKDSRGFTLILSPGEHFILLLLRKIKKTVFVLTFQSLSSSPMLNPPILNVLFNRLQFGDDNLRRFRQRYSKCSWMNIHKTSCEKLLCLQNSMFLFWLRKKIHLFMF